MAKVALYNMEGAKTGDMEVSDAIFAAEINNAVLHAVVVNQLANKRQGTQSTKTRTEVAGGGAKPWRQKGTGRARQGSTRSPQWTGGGVALGPKPRSYRYTLNKKVRRLAMKSALSAKYADYKIFVVEDLSVDEIKTSKIVTLLKGLEVNNEKALIVTADANEKVYKSARNIKGVTPTHVGTLNVYDILKHDAFVVSKDAVLKIEEVLA
ncbi:MAG: 50S ribosomal protein L4 [Clostridia bacterium]|nr:50S ribosomal protein L4 [Clostridia bacterium]